MLPNILTISRIFFIPMIMICFYLQLSLSMYIAFALFVLACITDFLDGYIARQYKSTSNFGKCFDPVADKLLVSTIIIMICGFGYVSGINMIAATIILFREIFVSGMREYLIEIKVPLPVTRLAKIKTATQMVALSVIILGISETSYMTLDIGIILLWVAAVLTIITGYQYFKKGISKILDDKSIS